MTLAATTRVIWRSASNVHHGLFSCRILTWWLNLPFWAAFPSPVTWPSDPVSARTTSPVVTSGQTKTSGGALIISKQFNDAISIFLQLRAQVYSQKYECNQPWIQLKLFILSKNSASCLLMLSSCFVLKLSNPACFYSLFKDKVISG